MEWALETYWPENAAFLEKYTPIECQLGEDHPRPWLGGGDEWFLKAVAESGVKLKPGGGGGEGGEQYIFDKVPKGTGKWGHEWMGNMTVMVSLDLCPFVFDLRLFLVPLTCALSCAYFRLFLWIKHYTPD